MNISSLREKKNPFSVNTKFFLSHLLKITEISIVLRTREFTHIVISFDKIYLVCTSKK